MPVVWLTNIQRVNLDGSVNAANNVSRGNGAADDVGILASRYVRSLDGEGDRTAFVDRSRTGSERSNKSGARHPKSRTQRPDLSDIEIAFAREDSRDDTLTPDFR